MQENTAYKRKIKFLSGRSNSREYDINPRHFCKHICGIEIYMDYEYYINTSIFRHIEKYIYTYIIYTYIYIYMDKSRVKINILKYQHFIVAIVKSKIFPFLLIEENKANTKLMEL